MGSLVSERLEFWAVERPSSIALIHGGKSISFSQLNRITQFTADELLAKGLSPGDLVAILGPHSLTAAVLTLSLMRAELIGVAFEPRDSRVDLEKFSSTHSVRAILSFSPQLPRFELSFLKNERTNSPVPDGIKWTLLTSGSMGQRKAVMIDAVNLMARTKGEVDAFKLNASDRLLNCLSFAHDLGLNQLLTAVHVGAQLIISPYLSFAELAEKFRLHKVTGFTGTPHIWRQGLELLRHGARFETQPRFITVSGGSLPAAKLEELRRRLPDSQVILTYGQTETFRSLINMNGSEGLGQPVPGVEVHLLDDQLVHFGDGVMSGYLGGDQAKRIQMEGKIGILTGDYFRRDQNGNFHFLGRTDDLIKRSDRRMSIFEIEVAISGHEELDDVAVTVIPDDTSQDGILVAFVRKNEQSRLSGEDLLRFCRRTLPPYKVPDRVYLLDDLPRTAIGKVDRPRLKSMVPHIAEVELR